MTATLTLLTWALTIVATAALLARWWWPFELAAQFQIQYAWGLLLGAAVLLFTRRWRLGLFAAALGVVHSFLLGPFFASDAATGPGGVTLRVMTLNVWARNHQYERVLNLIREASPDVVVLEEIPEDWARELTALKAGWPYSEVVVARLPVHGIALLSKYPLDDVRVERLVGDVPAVVAHVDVAGQPLTLVGVHLARPMSRGGVTAQLRGLHATQKLLEGSPGVRVVLGDFNSASWAPAVADFLKQADLRDSRLGRGVRPSWPSVLPPPLRIPIDHVFVSPQIGVERFATGPFVGSDHLPVLVDLRLPQANSGDAEGG